MSALLARLGLAESRVVSLSVLGRGNGGRHVHNGWWGGRSEQTRKASWWKKSYDGGTGSNEFGLGTPQEKADDEREAHKNTSEFVREKGWGLSNTESEEKSTGSENRARSPVRLDEGEDKLNWSQSSEDAYWDFTSQSVDEDQQAPRRPDSRKAAWGGIDEQVQSGGKAPALSTRSEAPNETGLGWSQQSEDAFWEHTSRARDDFGENEQAIMRGQPDPKIDQNPSESSHSVEEPQVSGDQEETRFDHRKWLPLAIEGNDQDLAARCLFAAEDSLDHEFLNSISEATFTDILHVLEPRRNILELSNTYMETSEHMAKQLGLMRVDRLMAEHGQMLINVARIRIQGGRRLTRAQYLILLKSAVDLGYSRLTKWVWRGVELDGMEPDLDMYNAYLGSFLWSGYYNSSARHRERVTNFNMTQRNDKRKDMPYANYHIGTPGGSKEISMMILDEMLKSGITANEKTYRSLITAAAREGEMDTVKSVLRTVWNIDVGRVMSLTPSEPMPKAKAFPKDSQQYPTSKLLWAIAHAYGINNNIPVALRMVDYVSREYDIPIDANVWAILFEWTFTLASPRSGTNGRDDKKTGQLPKAAVERLFLTMTRAPYLVEPTMGMYNLLIKNLSTRGLSAKMTPRMAEGAALNQASISARNDAWKLLERSLDERDSGKEHSSIAVARRQWENAAVVAARNRLWMKQWVRLFLNSLVEWHRDRKVPKIRTHGFSLRYVPRLLLDWRHYAGAHVKYDLPTGILEIQMFSEEDMLRAAVTRERIWLDREATVDRARLLVGDALMVPGVEAATPDETSMRSVSATTRRLREARERVLSEHDYHPEFLDGPRLRRVYAERRQSEDGEDGKGLPIRKHLSRAP
jgi:hypothetical protein